MTLLLTLLLALLLRLLLALLVPLRMPLVLRVPLQRGSCGSGLLTGRVRSVGHEVFST
jgi:hypothetical protein